jgi:hypothetical protein
LILNVIITLLILAVILWLLNSYAPIPKKIKTILNVVIVILALIWLLRVFGVLNI